MQTCSCGAEEKRKISVNMHTTHTHTSLFLYEWMMYLYSALLCIAVHPLYNHVGTFHWLFYSTALFTLANYFQFIFLWNCCVCLYNLYKCYFVIKKIYIIFKVIFLTTKKRLFCKCTVICDSMPAVCRLSYYMGWAGSHGSSWTHGSHAN